MTSPTVQTSATLFRELAEFFATAPSKQQLLNFRPSESLAKRASELLELNRQGALDRATAKELDQFDHAENLMRMIKATILADQSEG